MTPATRSALAAIQRAMLEDPAGLVGALVTSMPEDERRQFVSLLLAELRQSFEATLTGIGHAEAYQEIADKARNIAKGYAELGEGDLCEAFAKFAVKLHDRAAEKVAATRVRVDALKAEVTKGLN